MFKKIDVEMVLQEFKKERETENQYFMPKYFYLVPFAVQWNVDLCCG